MGGRTSEALLLALMAGVLSAEASEDGSTLVAWSWLVTSALWTLTTAVRFAASRVSAGAQ